MFAGLHVHAMHWPLCCCAAVLLCCCAARVPLRCHTHHTLDILRTPGNPLHLLVLTAHTDSTCPSPSQDVINRPIGYGGLTARTQWGFSKKNELMNGRLAMLGISAALLFEGASGGLGPLGQLAWWAGLQPTDEFYGTASMVLMGWAVLSTGLAVVKGNWGGQLIAGDEDVY